jgi:hypothetical protein
MTGTLPCVVKVQVTELLFVMMRSRRAPAPTDTDAVEEYVSPEIVTVNVLPDRDVDWIAHPVEVILEASTTDAVPLTFDKVNAT